MKTSLMMTKTFDTGVLTPSVASFRGEITDAEFKKIQAWIYEVAGISLSDHKKALVMGRLAPRMRHFKLDKYMDYFNLLVSGDHPAELQIAIDRLTTNETYFFRESKHFDYLSQVILKNHPTGKLMRVWSAASSSGEEPYSIAMLLQDDLGGTPWEILASDLSIRVLERARLGHYSLKRTEQIPKNYLRKYCLKGVKQQEGTFLVNDALKKKIVFQQINLNETLPAIGEFDLIFIRNVMIYFDAITRREVTERVVRCLKRGGYLFIGHSESLNGITSCVKPIQPAIYRKQ